MLIFLYKHIYYIPWVFISKIILAVNLEFVMTTLIFYVALGLGAVECWKIDEACRLALTQ
jgi:hypothetical protein